ncbi:hypothetical protein Trydic_g17436 [Trypoxylus dichotomus]
MSVAIVFHGERASSLTGPQAAHSGLPTVDGQSPPDQSGGRTVMGFGRLIIYRVSAVELPEPTAEVGD